MLRSQTHSLLPFALILTIITPLFFLSGAAALIYQSLWVRYLSLILGSSAHAQSLVLMLFMGGMAAGAWFASRYSSRSTTPLLWYAAIELCLGLMGMAYHSFFDTQLLPLIAKVSGLDGLFGGESARWLLASGSIVLQTMLLGATFPLMVAAMWRVDRDRPGTTISFLYFVNSLGAAMGALFAVFILLPGMGMPGSMLIAGLINVAIALIAWLVSKVTHAAPPLAAEPDSSRMSLLGIEIMIAALLTGAASFIYEIAWIRALSLVFGSTMHSFEIMLTAFISGIAFGGFYIRKRIDSLSRPLAAVGIVQVLMGTAALATVPIFIASFDWVAWLMHTLQHNDNGYDVFNVVTAGVAILVMFPATFFAGMTLPLLTVGILRAGSGEAAIGKIYAANTIGTILGVMVGFHVLLPLMGLRETLVVAAVLDVVLGLYLLARFSSGWLIYPKWAAVAFASATLVWVLAYTDLQPERAAAGTFRYGRAELEDEISYYRDGKTTSVAIARTPKKREQDVDVFQLINNGKPDAALTKELTAKPTADEPTMIALAAFALAFSNSPEVVGAIGFGSGLTTHTLLGSNAVQRVETVEIEPFVVEGARVFENRISRALNDPRSIIIYDDARAYFTGRATKLDALISEPSNPWISGVANLFTEEFYRFVKGSVKPGGVLVQWLQQYEIHPDLLRTIILALDRVADDYILMSPQTRSNNDMLIIASFDGPIRAPSFATIDSAPLRAELSRVGIASEHDILSLVRADKKLFAAYNRVHPVSINSDYFPIVSLQAPRDRFANASATQLSEFAITDLPIAEMLVVGPHGWNLDAFASGGASRLPVQDFLAMLQGGQPEPEDRQLAVLASFVGDCQRTTHQAAWIASAFDLLRGALVAYPRNEAVAIATASLTCLPTLGEGYAQDFANLMLQVAHRDAEKMAESAHKMITRMIAEQEYAPRDLTIDQLLFIKDAYLLGALVAGRSIEPTLIAFDPIQDWKLASPALRLRHQVLASHFNVKIGD